MLILNVPEHEYDFCCSNYSVIFLVLFCFYFDVGFLFSCLLIGCCYVVRSEISITLMGHLKILFSVIFSTCKAIYVLIWSCFTKHTFYM
jgi:hypothetical protein